MSVRETELKKYNPELAVQYCRKRHLKERYGISTEEYEALLEKQNGVCAICGGLPGPKYKNFTVDMSTNLKRFEVCCVINVIEL